MNKQFPKYESNCHGAPVRIVPHQKVKYFCTEEDCGQPCIAVEKK